MWNDQRVHVYHHPQRLIEIDALQIHIDQEKTPLCGENFSIVFMIRLYLTVVGHYV